MKRIFILSFLTISFGFVSATDINLSSSMRLSENEGIVQLPRVTINFTTESNPSFDLVIPSYLIFQTPENITINGNPVQPMVSFDNKKLTFKGNFTGAIIIDGIRFRCYDENIDGGRLGLDRDMDGQIDTYTTNVIEQDRDGKNSDSMIPLPVSNLKYTLSGMAILLSRRPSPDLDLVNTTVEIYKNNGYLRYFTVGAKDTGTKISDLDTTKDTIKILVSAKDTYYMSAPTSIEIPKQQVPVEVDISTGTITGTEVSTGTTINTATTIIIYSGDITSSPFSAELNTAYQYAYSIGITTMPTIQQANINGSLIRAHMAKMIVNYAKEVLGKTPNTNIICVFTDTDDQTSEMKGYIEEACQMGIMGVNTTEFNPNGTVTRAQFGTVLSRVLYGTGNEGGTPYYVNHLQALKDNEIITNTDPDLQEIRGYVMLMLQRSAQ